MTARELAKLIESYRFDCSTEARLQEGLGNLFGEKQLSNRREVPLNQTDRIDFLLANRIGVEVKIQGSRSDLVRQLQRYAKSPMLNELVLVTSRVQLARLPDVIGGKRVCAAVLMQGIL